METIISISEFSKIWFRSGSDILDPSWKAAKTETNEAKNDATILGFIMMNE